MLDLKSMLMLGGGLVIMIAWKRFGPGHPASGKAVRGKIAGGATIIDVRTASEFSSGAYPKSRNIPLDVLASRLDKLGAKDTSVIVYCASGSRSAQAARMLKSAGFTDVTNAGGLGSMPR
jgi:phage shock protein E